MASSSRHPNMDGAADHIDYAPFVEATKKGDWTNMKSFLDSRPEALTKTIFHSNEFTAIHYMLKQLERLQSGRSIVDSLLKLMKPEDLDIVSGDNIDTPFVTAVKYSSCGLHILRLMLEKSSKLATDVVRGEIPVYTASESNSRDKTKYLFSVTNLNSMTSMEPRLIRSFLWNLVHMDLYDDATKLVNELPENPRNAPYNSISALAPKFSEYAESEVMSNGEQSNYEKIRLYLKLVCVEKSGSTLEWFTDSVCRGIVESAESGSMKFTNELFKIRPDILSNKKCRGRLIQHTIRNRQDNLLNLIHKHIEQNDFLKISEESRNNNLLHLVAQLAPSFVLDRKSGAILQMQSERQWFKEVSNLASPKCREARNNDEFTPRELFIETHKTLMQAGEKSMKETAQSCTVVGALIVTIMFAATFTLPGDDDKSTLTKVFIIFDAISLYLSTASVVICLGLFTSRYADDDFLVSLPMKLILGLSTLSLSLITMMVAFCLALLILLHKNKAYVVPLVGAVLFPILIFFWSTSSLPYHIIMSTYRPGIIYKKQAKALIAHSNTDTTRTRGDSNAGQTEQV